MGDEKLTKLADPASAIASYLDELLSTATDSAREEAVAQPPEPVVAKPVVTKPIATRPDVAEPKAELKPEPRVRPVVRQRQAPRQTPVVEVPKAPPAVVEQTPEVADEAAAPPQPEQAAPLGRPEWSEKPFECLIFRVAGLQLAVPLILLGAIHRMEDEVKPIPGSPRWYMGIRPDKDMNLRVVDTAEWIMAGRVPQGARENYRFVIRLDSSEWGLACDDVAQSFTLKPDEVRWRTARSKRPWLAGTVIKHMCALIDVRTMADLLVRAEREHHLDLE